MTPVKLTKSTVLEINAALGELAKLARGPKLAYAIAKDLGKLQPEVRAIEKAREPSAAFAKIDAERAALAEKHAARDEQGHPLTYPVTQNGVATGQRAYQIENPAAFEAAFEALKEQHAETLAEREAQLAAWRQLLDDDTVVELHTIPLELVEADPGVGAGRDGTWPLVEILRPLIGTVITEE